MEAMVQHCKQYTEGFHVPAGKVYAAVEAPKGEFGVHLVADSGNRPCRANIHAPNCPHLAAMENMYEYHMLAGVPTILGSLDIIFGKIDQ